MATNPREQAAILRDLVREASEIMQITYAGDYPAGIEGFLVRADRALKAEAGAQALDAGQSKQNLDELRKVFEAGMLAHEDPEHERGWDFGPERFALQADAAFAAYLAYRREDCLDPVEALDAGDKGERSYWGHALDLVAGELEKLAPVDLEARRYKLIAVIRNAASRALDAGGWQAITAPDRGLFLVTNNMAARDAHGYMSHVWVTNGLSVGHKPSDGRFMCFDLSGQRVVGLTHFRNILPAPPGDHP